MRYHSARACAYLAIIRYSHEYFLHDRSRCFARVDEKAAGCPGRPAIHATELYPALILIGAQGLHHFILAQKVHGLEACPRPFTHIQSAGHTVPISRNLTRGWFIGIRRRGRRNEHQESGRRPAYQPITSADLPPGPILVYPNGCDNFIEFKKTKRCKACFRSLANVKSARRYPIFIPRWRWRRRRWGSDFIQIRTRTPAG